MLHSGLGKYIAPTALGAGYAISKMISLRALDPELAVTQDFTYQFLAGVLLGFAIRPPATMIYWHRTSSIFVFSTFLLTLGPLGQYLKRLVWGLPFDQSYWTFMIPEIIAAVIVSILSAFLLPSKLNVIHWGLLLRKIKKEINLPGVIKIICCGLIYALLFIGFQSSFDESFAANNWTGKILEFMNLPPISSMSKFLLLWAQGILGTLVLIPFCVLFFREKVELIIVFGSLTFVVAEFAPAFANFQRIEPLLLVDQVFLGFCIQFLFVAAVMFSFGRSEMQKSTQS